MNIYGFTATREDGEWAQTFVRLYTFLSAHPNSEDATLLLSTCRNAYLTVNAEFADVQQLLGGATASPLRSGLEMIDDQGKPPNGPKIKSRFQQALATVAQIDDKARVWATRSKLHESILELYKEYEAEKVLDAISIRDIILGTDVGRSDPRDGRHSALLRLDLTDRPHLRTYFEALKQLRDLTQAIARFGMCYADTIPAPPPPPPPPAQPKTLDLFAIEEPESESEPEAPAGEVGEDRTVAYWAEKIAVACKWTMEGDDSELRVKVLFNHPRPAAAAKKADYTFMCGAAGEVVARMDAVAFLREALWCAHGIAAEKFDPNVSGRPMPDVFDIFLPVPRPAPTNAEIQSLTLGRKACAGEHSMPNKGKMALAHLAVPEGALNLIPYTINDAATREAIEADVAKAVQAAKANSCLAVVFPEYSIPQSMRGRLLGMASSYGVTIIGGFEGAWVENKLADEVFVAIPGEPELYNQFKQSPSLGEQLPAGMYRGDSCLNLFTNSPIGDFAVLVCSDFLETATLDAWALAGPLPDILFVVARNRYSDLYKSMAITDSFRLYCTVAVCNVRDSNGQATSDGTYVISPKKDQAVDLGADVAVDGVHIKKITVHDIHFSAVRGRERGKPEPGFFAVPRSAKRV